MLLSERLEEITPKDGLNILMRIVSGEYHYTRHIQEDWKNPMYLFGIKIASPHVEMVEFIGSEGITASIGPWILAVMERLDDLSTSNSPIKQLRMIKADAGGEGDNHMVFFSIVTTELTEHFEIMVGGCTDFSGEGGKGTQDAYAILRLLSSIYDVPITVDHYEYPIYDRVSELIQKTEQERYEESHAT
jgi:hypothetical protein